MNNSNIVSIDGIRKELDRIANNCRFYKEEDARTHFINEVGCLRGAMYIADVVGMDYPKMKYYDEYIKPVYEIMEREEKERAEQFVADMYHCSETWGQKTTEKNMLMVLEELNRTKDPEEYCPSNGMYKVCTSYWNHLCDVYPN